MTNLRQYFRLAGKNIHLVKNFMNLGFIQASNALIQVLLFPLIIRIVGLESFGYVAVAGTYAGLLALIINYGTNLSGIKDIALARNDSNKLSDLFFSVYQTRVILFVCSLIIPLLLYRYSYEYADYFLLATTIAFAEVFNPLFFFNGIEKLFLLSCANLLAKLLSAILIVIFVTSSSRAGWVNFYLGIANVLFYGLLSVYIIKKYRLGWKPFSLKTVWIMLKGNFYLVCNNLATQVQQSFFLFLVSSSSNAAILGAYSLCDKVIWSFRLLLIAFSSAIYPKAAIAYQEKKLKWKQHKKKVNRLLAAVFIAAGVLLYFLAQVIVWIFTGSGNELAATYIRWTSIVPLLAALNALNVIELLVKNQYRYLFYCSLALTCISVLTGFLVARYSAPIGFGLYPIVVEAAALFLFLYFIRTADKIGTKGSSSF